MTRRHGPRHQLRHVYNLPPTNESSVLSGNRSVSDHEITSEPIRIGQISLQPNPVVSKTPPGVFTINTLLPSTRLFPFTVLTSQQELAAYLGVRGLPMIIFYKKGKRIDHHTTANINTIEEAIRDNS